jgi:lipopolysaccharide export system protein LptA
MELVADDLRASFEAGVGKTVEIRKVVGTGHTRLRQMAPLGEEETSSGDALEMEFAKQDGGGEGMQVTSSTQTGHVVIHTRAAAKMGVAAMGVAAAPAVSDAGAERAVYDGGTGKLTLSGGSRFVQGDTSLNAETISLDQKTSDVEAQGTVMATLASETKPGATTAAEATHVSAERARLGHASGLGEFFGTDAKPARLWQGGSQVQAADLLFDRTGKSLTARPGTAGGLVHAVFATESGGGKKPGKEAGQVVRVVSAAMDYNDVDREALFGGGVQVEGVEGQVKAQRGVLFLNPAQGTGTEKNPVPFGGSVRRVVMNGDVVMIQPGRTGTGDQLVYTAADSSFILTGTPGKPPHMVDAQQGSVTGPTLLFHSGSKAAGDRIVVAGGVPGAKPGAAGRVHTETEVRQ